MHVTGAVKGALTNREVRLWKSGEASFKFPFQSLKMLGNQVLRSSINKSFDFVHKIDYQASFPLEFQVQCVQLPKYVNKIG